MGATPEIRYVFGLENTSFFDTTKHRMTCSACMIEGPIMRISPTLLAVSDSTKLPDIYHRYADKSKHYITGSFGKTEMVFNMQSWKEHAYHRKLIAGPVGVRFLLLILSLDYLLVGGCFGSLLL